MSIPRFSGGYVKRLLLALLIGCVLASVPATAFKIPSNAGLSHLLKNGADALLFPGYVVALALSLGRFHDVRFGLIVLANIAIYAGLAYLALTLWAKFRAKFGGPFRNSASGPSTPPGDHV